MKNRVEASRCFVNEEESLAFYVYLIDEIDDELRIGNYHVSKDGSISCEIDEFISLYRKDLVNLSKVMMLNNGLKSIMQLNINDNELFANLVGGTYIVEKDPKRFQRANEYILEKGLSVDVININNMKR